MTTEAEVKSLAHAGEESLDEVLSVLAEYIAPIAGLLLGWVLGSIVGGVGAVGQFAYNLIEPISKGNDPTRACDAIGGVVMGGIWACLGGAFWSAAKKPGKKIGSIIACGVMRFISGLGFGMAANAVVSGLTGNVKEGWIESAIPA